MNYSSSHSKNSFFWNDPNTSSPLFATGLNNGPNVLNSTVKVRLAYLRKVYGILSLQLALTTIISVFIMITPAIQGFLAQNYWILLLNLVANFAALFGLLFKRNEYPTNFYLLGAFTLFNSLSIGMLISQYDAGLVVQAFFLTTSIVIGLTLYTLNSKSDFTWLGGILSSLIMVSFFGGLIHLFIGNSVSHTLLSVFGAFLFSGYIIYDTQLIMKHLSAEEYIVGVLNLYLDIINLFIKILRILQALKSEERPKDKKKK